LTQYNSLFTHVFDAATIRKIICNFSAHLTKGVGLMRVTNVRLKLQDVTFIIAFERFSLQNGIKPHAYSHPCRSNSAYRCYERNKPTYFSSWGYLWIKI